MTSQEDQCKVFEEIDALSEARSVQDLVRRLQPILNRLAYVAVAEGSVMATHEEWHEKFTDRLYEAASNDRRAPPDMSGGHGGHNGMGAPIAAAPRGASRSGSKGGSSAPRREGRDRDREALGDSFSVPGVQAVPRRQAAGSLPPSLAAIMNGTHTSLSERDDD